MTAYISFSPKGVFAYDENRRLIAKVLFSGNISQKMNSCLKEELSKEEKELLKKVKDENVIFEVKKSGYLHKFPDIAGEELRKEAQDNELMHNVNLDMTVEKLRNLDVRDKLIIQSINAIDELDKSANLLSVRLREWYGLYFPEFVNKIQDNEKFVNEFSKEIKKDKESIGSELSKNDIESIRKIAGVVSKIYDERKKLEEYIETKVKEIAPNMNVVAGPQITAHLIALAGGMERLAKFPSSTIQILGAEKSLFRFLCGETKKGPKYGVLFAHALIQHAPREKRGKVARMLASKVSLAAKVDFYKGKFIGDKLKEDLNNKMKSVIQ